MAKSTWTFISNRAGGKLKQGWHYLWKKKAKHIPCSLEKKKHGQLLNYQWSRTDWIGSTPYSARYIVDASFMTKWLFTIQRKARESFQIYGAGILPALTWFRVRAGIILAKCGFCHVKEPTILSTWRFSQEPDWNPNQVSWGFWYPSNIDDHLCIPQQLETLVYTSTYIINP